MEFLIFIVVVGIGALLLYSAFFMGKLFIQSPLGFILYINWTKFFIQSWR